MQIAFRGLAVRKLFQPFAIIGSNMQKRSILSRNRNFFHQNFVNSHLKYEKLLFPKKWDNFVSEALNQK